MKNDWKRAGLGVCTATAVVLSAGLLVAPAAQAAPGGQRVVHPSGLLGGSGGSATASASVNGTVTGLVNGLLGGRTSSGAPAPASTVDGTVAVNLGGTMVDVAVGGAVTTGTGASGSGGSGTGTAPGTGITPGTDTGPTTGAGGTSPDTGGNTAGSGSTAGGTAGSGSSTGSGSATGSGSITGNGSASDGSSSAGSGSTTPAPAAAALRIRLGARTIYPVKDGYRDAVTLHIGGTSAGGPQPVTGVVVIKRGGTEVKRWSITSTDQDLVWNGRASGKVVPGVYELTCVVVDASGAVLAATDTVTVSKKRLVAASHTVRTRAVSGVHAMSAKPKAGLSKGRVLLRLTTRATGVSGKQYLVFSHQGKRLRVRVLNGTHTTRAVAVPKSFTSYRVSHTWEKGSVHLLSAKYHYRYKTLK